MKSQRPIPEEMYERVCKYVEGPMNERVERLMRRRLLLAPAGLMLTLWGRSLIAMRTGDLKALVRKPTGKEGGAA